MTNIWRKTDISNNTDEVISDNAEIAEEGISLCVLDGRKVTIKKQL